MIAGLALRWVVTVLFGVAIVECLYALAGGHRKWTDFVRHALHLVMSLAMIVMAWPFAMMVPNRPPMAFFLVAALWFVGMAAVGSDGPVDRLTNQYHAAMMAAMAWMYAVMDGALFPGADGSHDPDAPSVSMPGMPGMATPSSDVSTQVAPQWITAVTWLLTAGFGLAAVFWLYRCIVERRRDSSSGAAPRAHAGTLCQGLMAAGMAIMFGVMP